MADEGCDGMYDGLIARFGSGEETKALLLMGSMARGDGGIDSDVDLLRLTGKDGGDSGGETGSFVIDVGGVPRLVTVGNAGPETRAAWFSDPSAACEAIGGVRESVILVDGEEGLGRKVKEDALAFVWDEEIQAKADAYVEEAMVGWVEEALKGVEGLNRARASENWRAEEGQIVGRLLNARFGLSHGLVGLVRVWKGVLLASDNTFLSATKAAVGIDHPWSLLATDAFGVQSADLPSQIASGLALFVSTVDLVRHLLSPDAASVIDHALTRIHSVIPIPDVQ